MDGDALYIKYGERPKVLMMGNGINKAYGFASWDGLIESVRTKDFSALELKGLKRVPYPLQPVILTGDRIDTRMKVLSKELSEIQAPEEEEPWIEELCSISRILNRRKGSLQMRSS